MEFKGTKGKWTYEYDGDGMRFNEISCYLDDADEDYRANALLISKAPEMLEMLQKVRTELYRTDYQMATEVKSLIKSATEL